MTGLDLRRRRLAVGTMLSVVAAVYAAFPPRPGRVLLDEQAFADTVDRMRAGTGYYDATAAAFAQRDTALGSIGGFRMPTPFLVWRWLPEDALWGIFVVGVVLVTTWLMLWMTRYPLVVAPITLYLLWVSHGEFESWLHPEWWVLPLIAGALLAHQRDRPVLAAALAAGACGVREIAFLLVIGGLIDSWHRRRAVAAWVVAAAAALVAFAIHALLAAGHVAEQSGEMGRLGTGEFPRTVLTMAGFRLPLVIGAAIWLASFVALRRRGQLLYVGPLALLPLAGVLVNRPYWGIVVTPLFLLWSLDSWPTGWPDGERPN